MTLCLLGSINPDEADFLRLAIHGDGDGVAIGDVENLCGEGLFRYGKGDEGRGEDENKQQNQSEHGRLQEAGCGESTLREQGAQLRGSDLSHKVVELSALDH